MDREELLRAGRNSLFVALVVSNIAGLIAGCIIAAIRSETFTAIAMALMVEGLTCYPLYRHLVVKKVGSEQ